MKKEKHKNKLIKRVNNLRKKKNLLDVAIKLQS